MSEVYAVKSGDWSDATVWNTGSLPASDDIVHANGFSIQLDVDVECDRLTTAAGDTAGAGGGFYIAADITIAADIEAGNSTCLNNSSVFAAVVSGNVLGGAGSHAYGLHITGNGDVNVSGNVSGGYGSNAQGLFIAGNGDVSVTGDITGGVGPSAQGLNITGNGDVSVNGDITGGAGNNAYGLSSQGYGTTLVTGQVYTENNSPAIYNPNGIVLLSQLEISGSGTAPIVGRGFYFTEDAVIKVYSPGSTEPRLMIDQGIPDGLVVIPENVEYCRVYSFLRMPGDTKPPVEQVAGRVQLRILTEPTGNEVSMFRGHVQANYNSDNGLLFWDVPRGAKVEVRGREFFPTAISFTVPDDVNFDFGDLVS